ncbi:toll/interleukin-1 receptor domain-containing protein [Oscillatoria sp. FACHB-1407]|uniref:toll/interleukin-1 receptor domain-containing protein n=1 Tax=Oscillatoria sp. FACHB-1407 TaxID=2692847 RepID=UPI001684FEE9|nr:toll/interleukin-1 receptor domain-containing protein [Oscillatoria sp. FACHB-1407]MBD2461001.1 toll/interleukin-1 receptor domain-containing protein [Oscillatoria sp. FACHB-1407]
MLEKKPSIVAVNTRLQPNETHTPGNDVFISYSRKDKAFVEVLSEAFKRIGRDPWVDWTDIYKGEEWWQAIQRGIESANTFIFVISPDSVASAVCRDEIDYAAHCHKRFLPIVRREGFDPQQVHPQISKHNWLFFRETDDFDHAFDELVRAIDTDVDYIHMHTRLLVRAIEWQLKTENNSYLLRGSDLKDAEQWLVASINQDPKPTEIQTRYIHASQAAKAAFYRARQRAKWIVMVTTVVVNMAIVTLGFYWFYYYLWETTVTRIKAEMVQALNATVAGVNGNDFATLARTPLPPGQTEPVSNPLYQKHQDWLYRVHTLVPYANPYSYTAGTRPGEILIVGDVLRTLEPEKATVFRQSFIVDQPDTAVYQGLFQLSLTTFVTRDQRGAQFAAFAPIRNSTGQIVGAMGLDVHADYVVNLKRSIRELMSFAYLITLLWFLGLSALILRVTRPLNEEE